MSMLINGYEVKNDTIIEFTANPKRPQFKSYQRYESYMKAKTIGEYLELADKKYARADLRYDEEHGYLKIFDGKKQVNEKKAK